MDGLPPPGEVHVWWWRLDEAAPRLPRLSLTAEEHGRAASFRRERDALRFLLARGLMRETLAGILRAPPASLAFGRACPACGSREHGKPHLLAADGPHALRFNLTHAGDLVGLAVANAREVGLDVERIDADASPDREGVLSPRERTLADAGPPAAFYALWTRKEAYLKMEGHGLSVPLADVDVSGIPAEGGLFARRVGRPGGPSVLLPIEAGPGYAAALAVEGMPPVKLVRKGPAGRATGT